ncbi:uncharacterized protein [Hetaerina americana]|uniref:uncharacterized protein n=1 Tax=Hetaerina americana TaxID=62018 RepID=UPI003A7F5ECB
MANSFIRASALVILAAVVCHSRTYSGRRYPSGVQSGPTNFGFFPSFAATIPKIGSGSLNPQPPYRLRRSSESAPQSTNSLDETPETDVLDVDAFIASHGLGDRVNGGPDGSSGESGSANVGEDVEEDGVSQPSPDNNRLKRQDAEAPESNLSWLLEQDAWEKVDDADELDWNNIGTVEFDADAETPSRGTRAARVEVAPPVVSEDAVYARVMKLAEELEKRRKEIEAQIREEGGDDSEGASSEYSAEESAEYSDEDTDHGESASREVAEDYYLDDMVRRRRSAGKEESVPDMEGRIEMFFESATESPIATKATE